MKKKYLIGTAQLEDTESGRMELEYYLLEECRDTGVDITLYGIEIKKLIRENTAIRREKESAGAISYSKTYVEKMIRLLIKNTVTPMGMLEIIDEYITKEGISA